MAAILSRPQCVKMAWAVLFLFLATVEQRALLWDIFLVLDYDGKSP